MESKPSILTMFDGKLYCWAFSNDNILEMKKLFKPPKILRFQPFRSPKEFNVLSKDFNPNRGARLQVGFPADVLLLPHRKGGSQLNYRGSTITQTLGEASPKRRQNKILKQHFLAISFIKGSFGIICSATIIPNFGISFQRLFYQRHCLFPLTVV